MSSLYKRATPSQARLLRIVEGAVKNVADAHKIEICPKTARSIAKRAAGTISAQYPELKGLAAKLPSDMEKVGIVGPSSLGCAAQADSRHSANAAHPAKRQKGGVASSFARQLRLLHKSIGNLAGEARRAKELEREKAFIEVLRIIATQKKDHSATKGER